MPDYRVVFEDGRVGLHHDVDSLLVRADDVGGLAEAVLRSAAPHLRSRFPDVLIEQREDEDAAGVIYTGFRVAARFTIQEVVPCSSS